MTKILVILAVTTCLAACIEQEKLEDELRSAATPSEGSDTGNPPNNDNTSIANNTRSSQGINDDVDKRREQVRDKSDRHHFKNKRQEEREVRSYDGTSNNVVNPTWGATFEPLQRLAATDYGDGISTLAGASRMSARSISNLVAAQAHGVFIENSYRTSDFLWQWGQFIDHDISLTDGSSDEPENIIVPVSDEYFDPQGTGTVEMSFHRANYDPETGTSVANPREQENEITSWIDGSMIYGSSDERNSALRVGKNSPLLATSGDNLLPLNVNNLTNASGFVRDTTSLFLAGDIRANETAMLSAMHTLWVREHNRIANALQARKPRANADDIFESTRRIVIAEIQKITYQEYLPALLGNNTMPHYQHYNSAINPGIYNEFSAAAYRLGHSEISDSILRLDANGAEISSGNLLLRNAFFSGINILKKQNDIDPILRGLATQVHQSIDIKVVNNLRNFLFGEPGSGGFDLVSLNIQRGRDHGLSSYNATRQAMGLDPVNTFSQITSDGQLQVALANAYASVDDIDLWVGGLCEDALTAQGSQLGELFTAIVVKQFDELRAADRFWYERYLTNKEKDLIKDVTLATVIRNNTNIGSELQDDVFFVDH